VAVSTEHSHSCGHLKLVFVLFWVLEDGGACVDFTNFADGLDRADGPLNYSLALNELGSQSVPVLAQGGSALCCCLLLFVEGIFCFCFFGLAG